MFLKQETMRKSLHIGVFDPLLIHTASPYCGDNVFAKGFEANNFQVTKFDYRAAIQPNEELLEIAEKDAYTFFWFGKAERIDPETIGILKFKNPNSIFCKWAADVRDEPAWHDLAQNQYIDFFFGTFGGDYLKQHLLPSMKLVSSIFAFTDSDFYKSSNQGKKEYISDVLWTGRRGFGDNDLRNTIIDYLLSETSFNIKLFGIENTNWLQDNYVNFITNAKIGIGSNSFDRYLYSSDRLGNYMSSGTFYLTQYINGIEKIFKKGIHLDWFSTIDELDNLIKYYLNHEKERKEVAKNGHEFVLKHFDYKPLINNCLNIINTGKSKYPWDDIFKN